MTDLSFLAQNIINQIADLYSERIPSHLWVPVRQQTNDQLDAWVTGLLQEAVASERARLTADAPVGDLIDELRAAAKLSTWAPNNADRMRRAADALVAVEKLHYPRTTETRLGTYEICDYDKTFWPCRTHKILNPEEG